MVRTGFSLLALLVCQTVASAQFVRIPVTAFRPSVPVSAMHGVGGGSHTGYSDPSVSDWMCAIGIVGVGTLVFLGCRELYLRLSHKSPSLAAPLPNRTQGWITVTAVPAGEAPESIRRAWIGVELPVKNRESLAVSGEGVRTRMPTSTEWGYVVDAMTAIALLAEQAPAAADWWRRHRPDLLQAGAEFVFRDAECTKIG